MKSSVLDRVYMCSEIRSGITCSSIDTVALCVKRKRRSVATTCCTCTHKRKFRKKCSLFKLEIAMN